MDIIKTVTVTFSADDIKKALVEYARNAQAGDGPVIECSDIEFNEDDMGNLQAVAEAEL